MIVYNHLLHNTIRCTYNPWNFYKLRMKKASTKSSKMFRIPSYLLMFMAVDVSKDKQIIYINSVLTFDYEIFKLKWILTDEKIYKKFILFQC